MNDPRLNSVHLCPPRRQEFRRARAALLGARSSHTVAAEAGEIECRPSTVVVRNGEEPPGPVQLWLIDRDYIYPLHVGLNTLGRSSDNDIVIRDGYVSRRHCAFLVHANNKVELFDVASKNGTFVNGNKLHGPKALHHGDEITMCERHLVFLASPPESGITPGPATSRD